MSNVIPPHWWNWWFFFSVGSPHVSYSVPRERSTVSLPSSSRPGCKFVPWMRREVARRIVALFFTKFSRIELRWRSISRRVPPLPLVKLKFQNFHIGSCRSIRSPEAHGKQNWPRLHILRRWSGVMAGGEKKKGIGRGREEWRERERIRWNWRRWAKSVRIVGRRDFIALLYCLCDTLFFCFFFFFFFFFSRSPSSRTTLISLSSLLSTFVVVSPLPTSSPRGRESDFYEAARLASPEMQQPVRRHLLKIAVSRQSGSFVIEKRKIMSGGRAYSIVIVGCCRDLEIMW